jgi:23S rRNA (cytidine1920-2'-O)/16S rRNA (cytidine1409-2'-O)-methyltransferase
MKSKKSARVAGQASLTKVAKPRKERLDLLMVERGIAPSRQRAQALLLAGHVRVNGVRMDKAGTLVPSDAQIESAGEQLRYASRGGLKLEGALADFGVNPQDKVCLDVGSSNGGFTDCLLQNGARRVYAVDVTIDQLDWKLRRDPRVIPIEGNARYLRAEDLGEAAELVTVDVSFISLAKILPAIVRVAANAAVFLILIKPQFELEKRDIGKGGIVREPQLHQKAIDRVASAASALGLEIAGVLPSRITGAEGNQEFFLHAKRVL